MRKTMLVLGAATLIAAVGAFVQTNECAMAAKPKVWTVTDRQVELRKRVDKGVTWVHREIDKLAGKGRISAGKAAKLHALVTGTVDKRAFADADWVIEAVPRRLRKGLSHNVSSMMLLRRTDRVFLRIT